MNAVGRGHVACLEAAAADASAPLVVRRRVEARLRLYAGDPLAAAVSSAPSASLASGEGSDPSRADANGLQAHD